MSSEEHYTPLLKPLPRRPFELSSSNDSSVQSSPYIGSQSSVDETHLDPSSANTKAEVSRTRSILNLTSSTLFGIYGPTAGTSSQMDASQPPTPWGTGAETPSRDRNGSVDEYSSGRPSLDLSRVRTNNEAEIERRLLEQDQQRTRRKNRSPITPVTPHHAPQPLSHTLLQAIVRITVLFTFGVAYGALVAHLHDNRHIAPVEVQGINRAGWEYLIFWGVAGVGIGNLLPWVDSAWDGLNNSPSEPFTETEDDRGPRKRGLAGVEWSDVVRGVGAFVGVAFAIRKLAWSSTLQLSLTLALANPFLWYLLDRTSSGLTLSTLIGIFGTLVLFFVNPSVIPPPTSSSGNYSNATASVIGTASALGDSFPRLEAVLHSESVGVATWIASVLFCSCVCFGNIGRLLVREQSRARG